MQDLIARRRAIYPVQYNDQAISQKEIESILEAANWAPTHRRTEPWRFKVFHSEAARSKLSFFLEEKYLETAGKPSRIKARKTREKPLQSGCVVAICMQRDPEGSVPEWEEVAATAMAVQNMWLRATELGIGSYWSTPGTRNFLDEIVKLNPGESCLGFFYMGKVDGPWPQGTRKTTAAGKTRWI